MPEGLAGGRLGDAGCAVGIDRWPISSDCNLIRPIRNGTRGARDPTTAARLAALGDAAGGGARRRQHGRSAASGGWASSAVCSSAWRIPAAVVARRRAATSPRRRRATGLAGARRYAFVLAIPSR